MNRITLIRWAPIPLAAVCATWMGWQFSPYTPLNMTLTVGMLAGAAFTSFFGTLVDAFTRRTFRCPKADCDFIVRLQHTDAGETRRWQELAHAHPHHGDR